ncbi:hypothetical protein N9H89_01815 [Flavobacteriaceae bacterium]|nr:hypothetical protein [Flavobacteriaceae bacterium]
MGQRIKTITRFLIPLFVLMGLGYIIQVQFNLGAKNFLQQSYAINSLLALAALLLLEWGIHKKKDNIAVLYLITVALKFITYFLFFHPRFYLDGVLNRQEFFIFFAPYAIGLILEIVLLARRYR